MTSSKFNGSPLTAFISFNSSKDRFSKNIQYSFGYPPTNSIFGILIWFEFLRKQGINIKTSSCASLENLDIEGLTEMKEHIEDLIAEKSAAESVEEVIVEAE